MSVKAPAPIPAGIADELRRTAQTVFRLTRLPRPGPHRLPAERRRGPVLPGDQRAALARAGRGNLRRGGAGRAALRRGHRLGHPERGAAARHQGQPEAAGQAPAQDRAPPGRLRLQRQAHQAHRGRGGGLGGRVRQPEHAPGHPRGDRLLGARGRRPGGEPGAAHGARGHPAGPGVQHRRGLQGTEPRGQVPALLELLDIPYTGSDPATLSLALDKALAKKIVRQHGIHTPNFQLMHHRQGAAEPRSSPSSR